MSDTPHLDKILALARKPTPIRDRLFGPRVTLEGPQHSARQLSVEHIQRLPDKKLQQELAAAKEGSPYHAALKQEAGRRMSGQVAVHSGPFGSVRIERGQTRDYTRVERGREEHVRGHQEAPYSMSNPPPVRNVTVGGYPAGSPFKRRGIGG